MAISRLKYRYFRVIICLIILAGCASDAAVEYYDNGVLKSHCQLLNGVKHGVCLEYFENGQRKSSQQWLHGRLNGFFEDYNEVGKVKRRGMIEYDRMKYMIYYYESGKKRDVLSYNEYGEIQSVSRFKESGDVDSTLYPFFYMYPGDSVDLGKTAIFRAHVMNAFDSLFSNGVMVLGESMDKIGSDLILLDTIAMINSKSTNKFMYEYAFVPQRRGLFSIKGELRFLNSNDTLLHTGRLPFTYEYYVE